MIAILADLEPAREFCRETLAPLLREARDGEELIHMLLCVEECGGDLGRAYIMNSKDLRAVELVERLCHIGVDSLKIEGRTKSLYYVARTAVDRKSVV